MMLARSLVALALVAFALASPIGPHARQHYVSEVVADLTNFINTKGQELDQLTPVLAAAPTAQAVFTCDVQPSPTVPTSVHQLRPSDIKVVGAIGDSITAALGAEATSLLNLINEWRGVSWAMGGDESFETIQTIPNIIRKFNPNIVGFSTGKCDVESPNAGFNVAITGAIAKDLPGQVDDLIAKMQANPNVDFVNDWKVINLWIGGNDLCRLCNGDPANLPENYIAYIDEALTKIITLIPRVYVNLVNIIDVTKLNEVDVGTCPLLHTVACKCITVDDATTSYVSQTAAQYNTLITQLATNPKFHSDTFTVEVQPFFLNTNAPRLPDGTPDRSYFAPDCFHFTLKAHSAAAVALWNNMLEAPGTKETAWHIGEGIRCPTDDAPYICTSSNNCGAASKKLLAVAQIAEVDTASQSSSSSSSNDITIPVAVGSAIGILAIAVGALLYYRRTKYGGYQQL